LYQFQLSIYDQSNTSRTQINNELTRYKVNDSTNLLT